jgi:hypothetical protein
MQWQAEKRKSLNIYMALSFMKLIIRIYEERRMCLNKNLGLQSFSDDV